MSLVRPGTNDPFSLGPTKSTNVVGAIVDWINQNGINAKENAYGAVGDGTTNDTAALAVWMGRAAVGPLYLPPGTYSSTDLTVSTPYASVVGAGPGLTTLKARSGTTKLLDIAGSATDVTISNLTLDGNGLASYGMFAEDNAVQGTLHNVEVINCTTAGIANADHNHSWTFDGVHVHLNTGRGVIWIKHGQNTRFIGGYKIYANTLGQVQLGEATTAMSLITFGEGKVQQTSPFGGVPNFQISAQINPLVLKGVYCESFGAAGTDITIDAGLSVSAVTMDGFYTTGNGAANYSIVVNSQVYMDLKGYQGTSFVTGNINDGTTTSRFFHINTNENGAVRVPFKLDRVNPVLSVFALTDAATVTSDARLGPYFTLSTANSRTMGAPSAPSAAMELHYDISNTSGGTITPTWNAVFKPLGGATGLTIGAGKRHVIRFYYDGTNWVELGRSGDI